MNIVRRAALRADQRRSFRSALAVLVLAAGWLGVGIQSTEAAVPSAGAAAGRSWGLWFYDGREGTWEHWGHSWDLLLTGPFEFGGKTWVGTLRLVFWRTADPGGTRVGSKSFSVLGTNGRMTGRCTPRWSTTLSLDCTARINSGPAQTRRLAIVLPVDTGPLWIPRDTANQYGLPDGLTYDPASRWHKGPVQIVAGRYLLKR